jgi:cytochrome P450
LLGVPVQDADRFRRWSGAFLSVVPMSSAERAGQVDEFTGYVTDLVAARRSEPGDALIDALIAAREGEDRLTEQELVMMILGLIAVGNEATSNSLARAVRTLLRGDRALWTVLLDDPGLLPSAVDELLRYSPPGGMFAMRQAREDVALPSGTLRAGQGVIIAAESALRDPDVYPDPHEVRFDRPKRAQLVFGGGPHYCLGAHLAKVELAAGIGCLLRRLPGLRLAVDYDAVAFTAGDILSTPLTLPVSW